MAVQTAEKLARRVVLCDVFRYGGQRLPNGQWIYQTAVQGDEIEVTQAEIDRAEALAAEHHRPMLGTADDLATLTIPGSPSAAMQHPDSTLERMDVADTVAYLNANNAEADRLFALEICREVQRPEVLDAIERVKQHQALTAAG